MTNFHARALDECDTHIAEIERTMLRDALNGDFSYLAQHRGEVSRTRARRTELACLSPEKIADYNALKKREADEDSRQACFGY